MFGIERFKQIVNPIIPYSGDNTIRVRQGDLDYPIIHHHLQNQKTHR